MEAVIRKWGNSPALRLPTNVLREAGYQLEQKVDLIVSRGRIVIQPCEKVEYDLDALISGINSSNVHDEVSFGSPVGPEALGCRALMFPTPARWSGLNLILRLGMNRLATDLRWSSVPQATTAKPD